jgi:hypothetical protein
MSCGEVFFAEGRNRNEAEEHARRYWTELRYCCEMTREEANHLGHFGYGIYY